MGVTLVPIGLVVASFFPLRSPIPLYLLAFGLAGAAMLLLPRICTAGTRAIRLVASPKGLLAVRLLQCTLLLVRVMMGLLTIGSTTSSLPMVSPAATPPPPVLHGGDPAQRTTAERRTPTHRPRPPGPLLVNARTWRGYLGLALMVVLLVLVGILIATSIGGSGH